MTLGTLAGIALVVGILYWMRSNLAKFNRRQQEVLSVIADAGFIPFGPEDGSYRTFQSDQVALRLTWDHRGYVSASFERRHKPSGWVSERELREALFNEAWDPDVRPSSWDRDDIATRLRDRLATMANAVASDDREMQSLLAATRVAQRRRWEEHLARLSAAARARRERKK